MGYRFELQHANMVAHLIDGDIAAFLDCFSVGDNIYSLKTFINSNLIQKRFFSSDRYEYEFEKVIDELIRYLNHHNLHMSNRNHLLQEIKPLISRLSKLLGEAKVKALLLPGDENNFISDIRMLKNIVDIHPEDSCLILQTPPLEHKQSIQLFNAFRGFEEALKYYDQFPGVLLWDDHETLFIPVSDEIDTISIFKHLLLNAKEPIRALKKYYSYSIRKANYIYFLHLSDLHLGKVNHGRTKELLRLIDTHSIHKEDVPIIPIITGDLMDSPKQVNNDKVEAFIHELNTKTTHESIYVLGNHDVDRSGIVSLSRRNKQATMNLLKPSQIEKFDEYKLIIIKFCSNQGGHFAQGEIGEKQLTDIAKELGKISQLQEYSIISILHHHPLEMENPDWYKKDWIERILGKNHEKTMKLNDADRFLNWCKEWDVKAILHGHKHIPNIDKVKGINCIGAGSSTGNILHMEDGKTYISFNVIKYDLNQKRPTQAMTYFEETIGTGVKHLSVEKL